MIETGMLTPEIATPGSRGLIDFAGPDELLKRDEEEAKSLSEQEQSQPVVLSLATHIRTIWQKHRDAKQQHIEPRLLNCLRLRQGKYDAATQAQITAQGGTDLFIKLTKATCRAAKAWMADIYTEKPFALTPTPIPDLPDEVEQQVSAEIAAEYEAAFYAHQRAGIPLDEKVLQEQAEKYREDVLQAVKDKAQADDETLENEINDDLTEGGWYKALDDVVWDIVTFPAAFLKGPITRMTKTLQWSEGQPIVEEVPKKSWERVSPFDVYPSPTAKTIQEGDFIERHRLSRQGLQNLIGIDGYSETAIRTVLAEDSTGGLKLWLVNDQERQMLENKPLDTGTSDLIDALQFWGSVPGSLLIEWGMEAEEIPEPTDEYQIEGWLIGNTVISAVINPDPLGRRPYFSASYDENPDSIWGEGVPELEEDVQQICNSSARAIVNNEGISSGPQIAVLADLLQPGMDVTTMYPWKIWQFKAEQFTNGQVPIQFFQPNPILDALLKVYDYFFKQASEVTGIPAYIAGSDKLGGAARALADYEKILTPTGTKKISELIVGDKVCATYSKSANVTGVFPQQGLCDIFRVTFSNGMTIDCDMEHRWSVKDHHDRKFCTLTLEEILEKGLFRKTKKDAKNPKGMRPKWMLPKISPVYFRRQEVPIDPYTMGALLGDGDARCRLTSEDKEIFDRIPYELGKIDVTDHGEAITRCIKGIRKTYRGLGLNCKSLKKFIPGIYFHNSVKVRNELLQGLMDTDGCAKQDGSVFFATSSKQLAEDFRKLVFSLGGSVNKICEADGGEFEIRGKTCIRQKTYRINFSLFSFKIFGLDRKQKLRKRIRNDTNHYTYIAGVEYVGAHTATCITVDSDDHLFLCANFIPTHNTASGLSMLMNAANKGLKAVVTNIDNGIIKPSVKAHWQNLMLYEPEKAQGDINIVARASEYLIMMESLQVRRMEFLNFTNNDLDNQIMGPAGRAEILRETAKTLKLPVDRIIPDKKSILNNVKQAEMQELMMNLSETLGIPVDQLMAAASGRGGQAATQPKAKALDLAGQPMGRS